MNDINNGVYNSPLDNSNNRSILSSPKGSFISPRIEDDNFNINNKSALKTLTDASFMFEVVRVKLDPGINPDRAMDSIIHDGKLIIFGGKDNNM